MELRLLGPVELVVDGRAVDAGYPKQRLVLAALGVDLGRAVPLDVLVNRLWDEQPPVQARRTVYAHLSRIRGLLARGDGTLVRNADGYRLDLVPDSVDVHRVSRLLAVARDLPTAADRVGPLRAAVAPHRGTPLGDLPGAWAAGVRERLARQRLEAVTQWLEAELELGNTDAVVTESWRQLAESPLAEPLVDIQLRALCAAGRRAEALDCYATFRKHLVEELGSEPGAQLRRTHESILRDEPAAASEATVLPRAAAPVPAQLPPDVVHFVGRQEQLALLDEVAARPAGRAVVLSGFAGVGKTSLAVHWAHTRLDRFPDGQLYADLRGHGSGRPASAGEVLGSFLRALGTPQTAVPVAEEEAAALYRSLVATRRVVVVLDNAGDAATVRALLPGTGPAVAVVTSRNPLTSLRSLHDITTRSLDVLSVPDATELICRLLGRQERDLGEHRSQRVAVLCDGLPLAVRIAAGNLVQRTSRGVDAYLRDLAADRLAHLRVDGGEPPAVRTVFELACAVLPPDTRLVFHLLGASPTPELSHAAAAALAACDPDAVAEHVHRLVCAGLCEDLPDRRIRLHDLVRQFAAELSDAPVDAALHRLFSHYHRTCLAAVRVAVDGITRLPHDDADPDARPLEFPDADSAAAWLDTELPGLVAAAVVCATSPAAATRRLSWQLADALRDFLWVRRHGSAWLTLAGSGLAAAQAAEDDTAIAAMANSLGVAHWSCDQYDDATRWFGEALDVHSRVGDVNGMAKVLANLGGVHCQAGELRLGREHCERAAELATDAGEALLRTNTRITLASIAQEMGDLAHAVDLARRALTEYGVLDRADGRGAALLVLSGCLRHSGDLAGAATAAADAGAVFAGLGARYGIGAAELELAATDVARGRCAAAAARAHAVLSTARAIPNTQLEADAHLRLGEIALWSSEHDQALQHYTTARALAADVHMAAIGLAAGTGRALALYRLGDHTAALIAAEAVIATAAGTDHHLRTAGARSVAALVLLATGEHDRADSTARTALVAHRRHGRRLWEARTLRMLATVLDRTGRPGGSAARAEADRITVALGVHDLLLTSMD